MEAFRQIAKPGQNALATLRQLYAGCVPYVLSAAVFGSLYFALYAGLKRFGDEQIATTSKKRSTLAAAAERNRPASTSTSAPAPAPVVVSDDCAATDKDLGGSGLTSSIAAFSATWITSLIEGPADHFKQLVQVSHTTGGGAGISTMGLIRGLYRDHGFRGLFSGYIPFVLGQIPYDFAEYFSTSQLINARNAFNESSVGRKVNESTVWVLGSGGARPVQREVVEGLQDCFLGALAGLAAVLTATPFEVVRSKLLAHPAGYQTIAGSPASIIGACAKIASSTLREKGPRAFFVGIAPRMAEAVPASALYWVRRSSFFLYIHAYVNDIKGGFLDPIGSANGFLYMLMLIYIPLFCFTCFVHASQVAMQYTRRALLRLDSSLHPGDALTDFESGGQAADPAPRSQPALEPTTAAAAAAAAATAAAAAVAAVQSAERVASSNFASINKARGRESSAAPPRAAMEGGAADASFDQTGLAAAATLRHSKQTFGGVQSRPAQKPYQMPRIV